MSAFFASIHELFIGAIVHANEKKMGRRLRQFYVHSTADCTCTQAAITELQSAETKNRMINVIKTANG